MIKWSFILLQMAVFVALYVNAVKRNDKITFMYLLVLQFINFTAWIL